MKTEQIKQIKNQKGYWSKRLFSELVFLAEYDENFNTHFLSNYEIKNINLENEISKEDVLKIESDLSEASKKLKELTVLMVGHAHIDMNWMWRYDETVSITLSTFRTILDFMDEYPNFTFAQSQASVYEIVEKYDPDMLEEIRKHVKEGRWEPTVSTWVEPDKNMPSGESLVRHILYSKEYISNLLDIDKDYLNIDFEPDSFGHNGNIPEILEKGGVRYYYHCRGYEGFNIYNWVGDLGGKVIAYREPIWYNAEIDYEDFFYIPKFSKENNVKILLKVYGVGDHGGGPTRKDINRIIDMMSWPLFPTIEFGTFHQFFQSLEAIKDELPSVKGELNAFATGCYTTETRIKRFTKLCEKELIESETLDSLNAIYGYKSSGESFKESWKKVLFNNFHDILPGSGTIDTREYALGKFQDVLANTSSKKIQNLSYLSSMIDVSMFDFGKCNDSISFGAGGGFNFSTAERNNSGKKRIYHLFNTSYKDYTLPSVITIWDYPANISDIVVEIDGKKVDHQIIDNNQQVYWSHSYVRILVDALVPAFGYTTIVIKEKEDLCVDYHFAPYPRKDLLDEDFVLENDKIIAVFDKTTCALKEFKSKKDKKNLLSSDACFELINEDASKEMSAWIIGRYRSITKLVNSTVNPNEYVKGDLEQRLVYTLNFERSVIRVVVKLQKNANKLVFECTTDFREEPVLHKSVPQLSFFMATEVSNTYRSDIPFGLIEREVKNMDMPSLNGVYLNNSLFMISNSKYGFRTTSDGVRITLIRNSYEPDYLPDYGPNSFDFAIGYVENEDLFNDEIENYKYLPMEFSHNFNHQNGSLPLRESFVKVINTRVSAFKKAEDSNGFILRLYDIKENAKISFRFGIKKAYLVDINEKIIKELEVKNNELTIPFIKGIQSIKLLA